MPKKKDKKDKKLVLSKFDITSISDNAVVVFIGKRQTGKSILVKDLLFNKRDIPVGTIISGTEGANRFYSKLLPKQFIHEEYEDEITDRVLKRQKKIVRQRENEEESFGRSTIDPRTLYLLDDCLYDNKWVRSKGIRSMFMNGRHYKILFMLTMQYALGIPPSLRTNIDYVFLLRENIVANRKRLYEQYAGMFPEFKMFCSVMDQVTHDFHCLVINCNANSNKLEDQVFWYKAKMHNDFRVGHPSIWKYSANSSEVVSDDDDDFSRDNGLKVYKGNYAGLDATGFDHDDY